MYELPLLTINKVGNLMYTAVYNAIRDFDYDWDTTAGVIRFKNETDYLTAKAIYDKEVNSRKIQIQFDEFDLNPPTVAKTQKQNKSVKRRLF